jgi:hypothetical protein
MTIQKTLTIQVSMSSAASQADLNEHLENFLKEMKYNCGNMSFQSWHKSIPTSLDESYPVEISVNVSVK